MSEWKNHEYGFLGGFVRGLAVTAALLFIGWILVSIFTQ